MNASKGPRVLQSRPDALTVAFRLEVPEVLYTRLLELKAEAKWTEGGRVPFDLCGCEFALEKRGGQGPNGYAIRLVNADATVQIANGVDRDDLGRLAGPGWNVEVTFRAVWLARNGLAAARHWARAFADYFARENGILGERVRRLDLCADIETDFTTGERDYFVGKSKNITDYVPESDHATRTMWAKRDGALCTGFSFSMGAPMSARLYDKREELLRYGADHEKHAVEIGGWNAGGWEGGKVWRLEFQIRREALEELGVSTMDDVIAKLDGLWAYATRKWLRLVVPGTATRKFRGELDPRWAALQAVTFTAARPPCKRARGKRGGVRLDQTIGTLLSHVASVTDLPAILHPADPGETVEVAAVAMETLLAAFRDRFRGEICTTDRAGLFLQRWAGTRARFSTLGELPPQIGAAAALRCAFCQRTMATSRATRCVPICLQHSPQAYQASRAVLP